MFVLGLILILLSAGSLVAVLASGTDDKAVLFGSVSMPTLVVFLAGAAALLLFIMGLELVRSGVRRANENRKAKKRLRTLEKREEHQRPAEPAPTAAPTSGHATNTTADTSTGATGGPTTRQDAAPTRADAPYQTPPPATR